MKDKKTDVKSLVEFKKVVEFGNKINGFVEELSKVLNDIEIPDEEEDTWEMKCPYEKGDELWCLYSYGGVYSSFWADKWEDKDRFNTGNTFPTKQAAELEAKRRKLLTRFRAFRDECNEDWKADWEDTNDYKFCLTLRKGELLISYYWSDNLFVLFGYFKNQKDAERAVELFGDEIKELFVEGE